MSKVKFLTIGVAALVLLNILLLFFLISRRPHPRPEQTRNTIIERLHFDEAQIAAYDRLIQQHRAAIRPKEDTMRMLRGAYYELLNAPASGQQDSILQRIGRLQIEIEKTHFGHFLGIKQLCRPEQAADFQTLSTELLAFFTPPRPRK